MFYIVIALIIVGLFVAVLRVCNRQYGKGETTENGSSCGTCGEDSSECGHKCMLEAAVKDVEYYDDEELDAFIGRSSDTYDDEEAEQFRYVLYTMRQEEVAGWCRSLSLRGINMPDQIKDEVTVLLT